MKSGASLGVKYFESGACIELFTPWRPKGGGYLASGCLSGHDGVGAGGL